MSPAARQPLVARVPASTIARRPYWWYARIIRQLRPDGGRLLQVDCGAGPLLRLLTDDFEAFGHDPSPAARTQCRIEVPAAVVLESWSEVVNGGYDVIVSIGSFSPRTAETHVQNLVQKLALGGLLVLAVPNPSGWAHRLKGPRWAETHGVQDFAVPNEAQWRMLLRAFGLRVVRVEGDGLWDPPYVQMLPQALQGVAFGLPQTAQWLWPGRRSPVPASLGECLVLAAERARRGAG